MVSCRGLSEITWYEFLNPTSILSWIVGDTCNFWYKNNYYLYQCPTVSGPLILARFLWTLGIHECIMIALPNLDWPVTNSLLVDTSLLRTSNFSPKLAISIEFDLCNQDTSQLGTAHLSPKVVLKPRGSTVLPWCCFLCSNSNSCDMCMSFLSFDFQAQLTLVSASTSLPVALTFPWRSLTCLAVVFLFVPSIITGKILSISLLKFY
jgi:hypothetical protein